MRSRAREEVSAIADVSPVRLSKLARLWIHEFCPDIIYSPLGSIRMMRIASAAAMVSGAPLLPHFMDDWPSTLFSSGQLLNMGKYASTVALRHSLELANRGICISDDMTAEYGERFGIPFSTFMNCVPDAAFNVSSVSHLPRARNGSALKLVYTGGLHLDRWKTLRALGRALESEPTESAPSLYIYAPQADVKQHGHRFTGLPRVILGESVDVQSIPATLLTADVLVHVEAFDPQFQRQTRLSISTKIPQYMASRRPILGVGPPSLASMLHIVRTGAGTVLPTNDVNTLSRSLPAILSDAPRLERMAACGFAYAINNHSRTFVANEFRKYVIALSSAAGKALRAPYRRHLTAEELDGL